GHGFEERPALRERRPDAPARVAELVGQMLQKSAERRPASAQAVAEALAPFAAGHGLTALRTSDATRTFVRPSALPRPRRPLLRLAGACLAAVLLVVLGLWAVARFGGRGPPDGGSRGTEGSSPR